MEKCEGHQEGLQFQPLCQNLLIYHTPSLLTSITRVGRRHLQYFVAFFRTDVFSFFEKHERQTIIHVYFPIWFTRSKKTGEDILPQYLARFYIAVHKGLKVTSIRLLLFLVYDDVSRYIAGTIFLTKKKASYTSIQGGIEL